VRHCARAWAKSEAAAGRPTVTTAPPFRRAANHAAGTASVSMATTTSASASRRRTGTDLHVAHRKRRDRPPRIATSNLAPIALDRIVRADAPRAPRQPRRGDDGSRAWDTDFSGLR
jgi:hypothetical protein